MATYADSEQSALFFSESADTKNLKKGEGLAGAPWETGNILFLNNVDEMKNFIRRGAAVKAGLRSACGIPLLHNNDIVGGLMFWVRESCFDEEKFKTLFQKLSSHISAEIKRKQLEQELNRVFRVAPDIICIMGNDGYFKKINPALSEMLGYTEEELLSKPFAELIHPDDRSITIQKTESLLNGKKSLLFENRYRAKSGRYLWISWTATPVNDEELVFAVGKNVTERKELEALLQKASSMARIGAWEFDLIHQTLSWSVITREIHEVAPDYLPDVKTIIHFYAKGESRESIIRAIRNAIENGESWDLDLHIITAMGNNRWVRSIGEAECIDGKCSRIFGSIQDIDSIKRGQEVVTQTLKEKNMILESIGDAFFAIDNSWLITYWNHMAEMVMNKNREEVLGRFFGEVFAEIGNLSFFTNFTEAVQKHETRHFEVYFQNQDAWYDVSTYPSESGLSVYFKDISYRKKAEKEIQESNERYNLAAKATNDIIWDWDLVKDVIIRSEDNMEKLQKPLILFG
jgi:PAS domain S-box-containing protein